MNSELNELKDKMPTSRWRSSMSDKEMPDEIFTEENIAAAENKLSKYIDDLIALNDEADSGKIMKIVEQVVVSFNQLNEEFDYYIDTVEREELADFIQTAAISAGLVLENTNDDITEEWREW